MKEKYIYAHLHGIIYAMKILVVLSAVICSMVFFSCNSCPRNDCLTIYNRDIEKQHVHPDLTVEKCAFDMKFLKKKGNAFYTTKKKAPYRVVNGVDISRHQGEVDFELLKENGYEFVILRLAYRRYGYESGNLVKDENFDRYYEDAKRAGFKIGVYVYSQAINDEEALEEAKIVIDNLTPDMLDLPVVYDPEFVFYDEARTDEVAEEVFCRNTELFFDEIEKAGFKTMLYANLMWKFFVFTPEILNKYEMWFAQYSKKPTSPYRFTFWQYSGGSKIEGVEKPCDMNVWFIPLETETSVAKSVSAEIEIPAETMESVQGQPMPEADEIQIELQETQGSSQ